MNIPNSLIWTFVMAFALSLAQPLWGYADEYSQAQFVTDGYQPDIAVDPESGLYYTEIGRPR